MGKGDDFAAIGKVVFKQPTPVGEIAGVVGTYDRLSNVPSKMNTYTNAKDLELDHNRILKVSRENGWSVLYSGDRLNNPIYS